MSATTPLTLTPTARPAIRHPLEPLTAEEVRLAVSLLRDTGKVSATTRFVSVSLKEPDKEGVHRFNGKEPIRREAFAVLFDNGSNSCYETTLSLTDRKLLSWKHVPGVQPTMTMDEQIECEQAVLASSEFKAAVKKHYGLQDTNLVMVDIWSAGYYGTEEERTRRLARPLCFVRTDPTDNGYARPIEGLRPVVDLNAMKVLRVEEYGRWPLPPGQSNYAADRVARFRQDIKPLEITQPQGPSFEVDGHLVRWQKWSFVIGFNAREGLTLHHLCYDDNGKKRSVLYRGSVSEMVVPYGDPALQQARKNAFDAGEYGLGMCANSLELGCDCLGLIRYFDGHLCTSRGEPLTIKNAVCMHEEDYGILWKHTDRRLNTPEVRRSRRLVISSIATVENYEYGFFWYLYQDGNIQFEVKLTGILSVGALQPGEKSPYGALVAPQVYAPNHQHFFNVRLDIDLDGTTNSAYQVDVVPDAPGPDNPYENAFSARATLLESEKQARAHLNLETARTWRFTNPSVLNALGEPVGYKFFPGDNCFPFASRNAWWRKRAGFVNHHVWVTPYREEERHAGGNYPNQSQGGDGLTRWTEQDRPLVNTDLVLWYTFGHTHLPRPEDYPVMPTAYIGFMLKPNGFFNENPANDVPPSPKKTAGNGACCH
jgi:primary-amine oxidase